MTMTLGTHVRRRRKELGLTQDELAIRLGYTDGSTVSNLERDRHSHTKPTFWRLIRIAEALQESLDTLIAETGMSTESVQDDELSEGQKILLAAVRTNLAHLTPDQARRAGRALDALFGEPESGTQEGVS